MKKAKVFRPNENNIGGRKQITEMIYNHHHTLVNIKPVIKVDPPRQHVDANRPDKKGGKTKIQLQNEFNEVFESFKKVANTKSGYIDHSPPKTMQLRQMLAGKYKKEKNFIDQEHAMNWKNQRERIQNVGKSMSERKKNQFDPVAYPSLFFRRTNEPKKDITLDNMFSVLVTKGRAATAAKPPRPASVQRKESTVHEVEERSMSQTAKSKMGKERPQSASVANLKEEKTVNDEKMKNPAHDLGFIFEIPKVEGSNEEAYASLKRLLIDVIIKYRIYKGEDLESLFGRTLLYNKHMDSRRLFDLFTLIKTELDD
jgi:hypothetical protein